MGHACWIASFCLVLKTQYKLAPNLALLQQNPLIPMQDFCESGIGTRLGKTSSNNTLARAAPAVLNM